MEIARVNHRPPDMQGAGASADTDVTVSEAINMLNQIANDLTRQINEIGIPNSTPGGRGGDSALPPPELPDDLQEAIESVYSAFNGVDIDQARVDLYAVLDLVLRVTQAQRKDFQQARFAGQEAELRIKLDAAGEIRKRALSQMVGSIASSLAQFGGAFAGNRLKLKPDVTAKYSAAAGDFLASGVGLYTAGIDAKKAELEAAAGKQAQATQVINDQLSLSLEAVRTLLEKLQSIEQSRQETNRGISRNL